MERPGGDIANGGRIEVAQRMAGHANAKTTGLYDRRSDDVDLSEVAKIGISGRRKGHIVAFPRRCQKVNEDTKPSHDRFCLFM